MSREFFSDGILCGKVCRLKPLLRLDNEFQDAVVRIEQHHKSWRDRNLDCRFTAARLGSIACPDIFIRAQSRRGPESSYIPKALSRPRGGYHILNPVPLWGGNSANLRGSSFSLPVGGAEARTIGFCDGASRATSRPWEIATSSPSAKGVQDSPVNGTLARSVMT